MLLKPSDPVSKQKPGQFYKAAYGFYEAPPVFDVHYKYKN